MINLVKLYRKLKFRLRSLFDILKKEDNNVGRYGRHQSTFISTSEIIFEDIKQHIKDAFFLKTDVSLEEDSEWRLVEGIFLPASFEAYSASIDSNGKIHRNKINIFISPDETVLPRVTATKSYSIPCISVIHKTTGNMYFYSLLELIPTLEDGVYSINGTQTIAIGNL